MEALSHFIGESQLTVMQHNQRGEEGAWFTAKLQELEQLIATMPRVYEQDGKGMQALVSLHYFIGSADWYITERDTSPEQLQAFGWADLGMGCGELGYISIAEIIANGGELDLHYAPRTLESALKGRV